MPSIGSICSLHGWIPSVPVVLIHIKSTQSLSAYHFYRFLVDEENVQIVPIFNSQMHSGPKKFSGVTLNAKLCIKFLFTQYASEWVRATKQDFDNGITKNRRHTLCCDFQERFLILLNNQTNLKQSTFLYQMANLLRCQNIFANYFGHIEMEEEEIWVISVDFIICIFLFSFFWTFHVIVSCFSVIGSQIPIKITDNCWILRSEKKMPVLFCRCCLINMVARVLIFLLFSWIDGSSKDDVNAYILISLNTNRFISSYRL